MQTNYLFTAVRRLALAGTLALGGLLGHPLTAQAQAGRMRIVPVAPASVQEAAASQAAAQPASGDDEIRFHGRASQTNVDYRYDQMYLCANNAGLTDEPYKFEFTSECLGNNGSQQCRARPSFIWTVKYYTEAGQVYEEKWGDATTGDYSKVQLYLFPTVPTGTMQNYANGANYTATRNAGNTSFFAYPPNNTSCINIATNSGTPVGDRIVRATIHCKGYSCNFLEADEDDEVEIVYYNRRVESLAVAGNPSPLCRDQAYTLNWGVSRGATSYTVSVSGGATVNGASSINLTGNSAALSLANVPASVTSINMTVVATNSGGGVCGTTTSESRTLTLPVRRAPAQPANMTIDGNCPSTSNKTVSVNVVNVPNGEPDPVRYYWSLSGTNSAGAYLLDRFNQPASATDSDFNNVRVVTPYAGSFTLLASAKSSNCGGFGPALSNTFQIGNLVPACPTLSVQRNACNSSQATLNIAGAQGLSYYFQNPYNISTAGTTVSIDNTGPATSFSRALTTNSSGKFEFDVDVIITSPCSGNAPSYAICSVHVFVGKFVQAICRESAGATPEPDPLTLLYPNPTTGQVTVQPEVPTQYQWVKVMNAQGQVLLHQKAKSPAGITAFDIQTLPTGLYQVQLYDGQKLTVERLMKE